MRYEKKLNKSNSYARLKTSHLPCFGFCELTDITVLRETPPTLGTNAFDDIASTAVIYVPSGSVYDYKFATNWSRYANKIHAIP